LLAPGEFLANGFGGDTDLADGIAKLLLGATELLAPPAHFPRLIYIDASTILRATILKVIDHIRSPLRGRKRVAGHPGSCLTRPYRPRAAWAAAAEIAPGRRVRTPEAAIAAGRLRRRLAHRCVIPLRVALAPARDFRRRWCRRFAIAITIFLLPLLAAGRHFLGRLPELCFQLDAAVVGLAVRASAAAPPLNEEQLRSLAHHSP
jgi:hypothetical protein